MLRNTTKKFGVFEKLIHWSIFIVISAQYYLVWGQDLFPEGAPIRDEYTLLHKSLGLVALLLGLFFVLWRRMNERPLPPYLQPRWQKVIATMTHHLLLTILILMPLLGYFMSCASGKTISFFGLYTLPNLIGPHEQLGKLLFQAHVKLGDLFIILIGLHIVAALYHHFIIKDNVLKRMI